MAFVSRSDRKYILGNLDNSSIGPGEYLPLDIPRSQGELKAPFNSKSFRSNNSTKEDIPGPGSYFQKKRTISPPKYLEKEKSFENEKSVVYSIDGTFNISNDISLIKELKKKPAFGSAFKRFYNHNTNVSETPGPGVYYKDDSFITAINKNKLSYDKNNNKKISPKYTLSSTVISTIPSKLHEYGYNFNEQGSISVNEDPLKDFKHLGTKNDSVGPGSYDVNKSSAWIKNSVEWSRGLKDNNNDVMNPSSILGNFNSNSLVMKDIIEDSRIEINNKPQKETKLFKADKNNVYKYFFRKRPKAQNVGMDLIEENFFEQSPGPGYYNQEIPKAMYKKEKFQFFGSSSDRFKLVPHNQNYPSVGPSSYFQDRPNRMFNANKKKEHKSIDKNNENEREKLPKNNSPGPGYYNLPRDFGKIYLSSVTDFGSRVKRFASIEKETDSYKKEVTNEKGSYSPVINKINNVGHNFINKLQTKLNDNKINKAQVKRIFDIKKSMVPSVGTYEPEHYYSLSTKIMKKVGQSDNSNSPFLSSINNRFENDLNKFNNKIGPGYYHRERKKNLIQSKAPFNITDKKFENPKIPEYPSPGDYDPQNSHEWNKKSYNNLFNLKIKMDVENKKEVSGYLKKKKGSRFLRIFGNTNLRWFEVHFDSKTFGYKNKHTQSNFSQTFHFREIIDFVKNIDPVDAKICDWHYGFQIKLKSKNLELYAKTEKDLKMWTFALNLILKRPEAYEILKPRLFSIALEIFEKPYLEMIKKKEMEQKRIKKEKEERKRLEEEKVRKIKEDADKLKRMEEYYKIEEEKENKNIYDHVYKSIIQEVSDNVLNDIESSLYVNKSKMISDNNNMNLSSISNSKVNLKVKHNLDDWGIYDSSDKKVELADLSDANPITKYKKQSEIDKEPKQIKELFKYEQSYVNFNNQQVEDINFRPASKSVKNQNKKEKINFNDRSFNTGDDYSNNNKNSINQSIFGDVWEISFKIAENKKEKDKETGNNLINKILNPKTGLKNESKSNYELSLLNQLENYMESKAQPMIPNTSKNKKKSNFEDINSSNVRYNKPKIVNPIKNINERNIEDKMKTNMSLNNTLESNKHTINNNPVKFDTEENLNSVGRDKPLNKNNSSMVNSLNTTKNKSLKEFLDFEDELIVLNEFITDRKNKKEEKIGEINRNTKLTTDNTYRSSDDAKKLTLKPIKIDLESKNNNRSYNEASEENTLEMIVYNNITEKINNNHSIEAKREFDNENLFPRQVKENIIFHKRNKSSYQKKITNDNNNINFGSNLNTLKSNYNDDIITNITDQIGLKTKSTELENFSMPILQDSKIQNEANDLSQNHNHISQVPQLPPVYKKKAQPIPPNNNKKKALIINKSNRNNSVTIPATPIEMTFGVPINNKKNENNEEDWFSHMSNKNNKSLNNSGTELKSKYTINVTSPRVNNIKNAIDESVYDTKKPNNIFSVFANDNSFMRSNRNEDSRYSIESDFNDSKQIIEQHRVLNKYKEELASIRTSPNFEVENKHNNIVNIDDNLKILNNLGNEDDDELNKILHKHIVETNLTTSQEKEELNYSTTKEVDELRNYSKIMKNANFISHIELKRNESNSFLANLNTNHSSNMRNSLASKNNPSSGLKKSETPKNNFIEKRLKESKFLNFDDL